VLVGLAAMLLGGAASVGDPLRDQLISQARAYSPARLAFDRTTAITRASPLGKRTTTFVERWDGRVWSLVSVNGRAPTPNQVHETAKAAEKIPVPGYYRLAELLSAAGDRRTEADGRILLTIPRLPSGTVSTGSDDISAHLTGEATIMLNDGQPWVQSLKVTAREPFKLGMLIKVTRFEQIFQYRLDTNGQPRLASQNADSLGQVFGQTGGESSLAVYAYR
jgi:hypothetical protein